MNHDMEHPARFALAQAAEILRLRAALADALALCDQIVDRMGPYDHYTPPTAEDIFALREIIREGRYK